MREVFKTKKHQQALTKRQRKANIQALEHFLHKTKSYNRQDYDGCDDLDPED